MLVACEIPFRNSCVCAKGQWKGGGKERISPEARETRTFANAKTHHQRKKLSRPNADFFLAELLTIVCCLQENYVLLYYLRRQMIAATRRKPLCQQSALRM